jgi:hypothetical protein
MRSIALGSIALAIALFAAAVGIGTARAASDAYIVNPLVSDGGTTAPFTDASLVNGWGLSTGASDCRSPRLALTCGAVSSWARVQGGLIVVVGW